MKTQKRPSPKKPLKGIPFPAPSTPDMWLTNGYAAYIKRRKLKDCPHSMWIYLNAKHSKTAFQTLFAQLFWETAKLRSSMGFILVALQNHCCKKEASNV